MATRSREQDDVNEDAVTVTINEWSATPALSLSEDDLTFIKQQINSKTTRLSISHTEQGNTVLESSRYVGVVSLPDGPPIEIRPKSAGENFLGLFRYANGLNSHTIDEQTGVRSGRQFVDALAALYADELSTILQRGIAKTYERTDATEEFVKGRIDVQRQLQRQGIAGRQFECTYDDLTADTVVNQAILYAASILQRLVDDIGLQRTLERQEARLRRAVTLRPVSPQHLSGVEVTRLNDYYQDALRLAELVIRNIFVENIQHGERGSFGLLVNMDEIFESVVERAVREAVANSSEWNGWRVEGQAHVTGLVTGGSPPVNMRPDFVVRDRRGEVVITGDAKWKTGSISQSDIYQLTAYQLADSVPGALIYPQQGGERETEYTVQGKYPLIVHELPTAASVSSLEDLQAKLEESAGSLLQQLVTSDITDE